MNTDTLMPWAPAGLTLTLAAMSRRSLDLQGDIRPECKPDGTLVTAADTSVEALLTAFLAQAEPDSLVLGEETVQGKPMEYLEASIRGRTWVIDPIDGTLLYCMRMPGWGISVGLMEGGRMVHGVVAFPSRVGGQDTMEMVYSHGDRVLISRASLADGDGDAEPGLVLERLKVQTEPLRVIDPVPGFPGVLSISQRVAKNSVYVGPQPVISTGSCVSSFRYLMQGSVSAYMIRMRLWDIAASWPLARRLGIRACLQDGTPMDLEVEEPVWNLEAATKGFLELRQHALFYNPERADAEWWRHSLWPDIPR